MRLFAPLLMTLALSAPGFGQVAEFWFGGGQSLISNGGIGTTATIGGTKDDVKLTDGFQINFRLTLNSGTFYGHEVGYAYNRTQLRFETQSPAVEQGMAIHEGFYNFVVYPTKEGSRIRPFATGGVHFANFVPPGSSATQGGGQTKFGFNYGGGIKVKLTSLFGLRLDFRQYNTGKPFDLPLATGRLRQNEISVGFGVLL
jgi:opacity protein-like surface antigen